MFSTKNKIFTSQMLYAEKATKTIFLDENHVTASFFEERKQS